VHARAEDGIRTGKDTGIGKLPGHDMAMNKAWLTAALTKPTSHPGYRERNPGPPETPAPGPTAGPPSRPRPKIKIGSARPASQPRHPPTPMNDQG